MGNVHRASPMIGVWCAVFLAAWLVTVLLGNHYSASLRATHAVSLAASTLATLLKDEGTTPLLELSATVVVLELIPEDSYLIAWWPAVVAGGFYARCTHMQ